MEAIGGYFELADLVEGGQFPHGNGVLLNTGRNALEYILRSIGDVKSIYLPYYTCEMVLEPLKKLNIPWSFYHINASFEIADEINLGEREYIIANNYYGIKDSYIEKLAKRYGRQLIVDCSQAFFSKPLSGIYSFYSMRKFVGVADGGVAYLGNLPQGLIDVKEEERTSEHDSHLLIRKRSGAESGFVFFQANEKKLNNQPIRNMSFKTKWILDHIDYNEVVERRVENFKCLHDALNKENYLTLPNCDAFKCPMIYPFMTSIGCSLRKKLIDNKVFVARYWPNVEQQDGFETEYDLSLNVLSIPCDQRYGIEEMNRIIDLIRTIISVH